MVGMSNIFNPVSSGGDWHHNAVVGTVTDDFGLATGFAAAGRVLVDHWRAGGTDDGLFMPIVVLYRHALELVLKAAIRESAARRRADGHRGPQFDKGSVDQWLAQKAGHSLASLANRLETYLKDLKLETLPKDTGQVLAELHTLDPGGDTFRYSMTRQSMPAARPAATHVDVVEMGKTFDATFSLLANGVMTVLDEYRMHQDAVQP
jgi:hypothetical protein